MSSFADAFWSTDYISGVQTVFAKLHQGCHENTEILNVIADRITVESVYAKGLGEFPVKHSPHKNGFNKDEGATLRQSFVAFLHDIQHQGQQHARIAAELDKSVRGPFHAWSQHHESQIKGCEELVVERIKNYTKRAQQVKKIQQQYFSKSRQLEDVELSVGGHKKGLNSANSSPAAAKSLSRTLSSYIPFKAATETDIKQALTFANLAEEQQIQILDVYYTRPALQRLIANAMSEIPLKSYKIPIIGTYDNTSRGDEIVAWARRRLDYRNLGKAERFGQALIDNGVLRPVGQVTNKFSAGNTVYQWLEIDVTLTKQSSGTLSPKRSESSTESTDDTAITEITDLVSGLLPSNEPTKLQREVAQLEQQYRQQVLELDRQRCELEEIIFDCLKTVEHCELNRLRQTRDALQRFAAVIGTPVDPQTEKFRLNCQSVNPESDLRYTIENYKTSTFVPAVVVYKNFSNSSKVAQSFGVDMVNVPFMVPLFLNYINNQEVAVDLWLEQSSLASLHQLRTQINDGQEFDANKTFAFFPISVVISTFKEFLLELPDPVISFTIYDVVKTIYTHPPEDHVQALINALAHLPKPNLSSLELILQYFDTLLNDAPDKQAVVDSLATALSPYLFRPRVVSKITIHDKHPALLIKDLLLNHKNIIPAVSTKQLTRTRSRAVSSSEVNRRAVIEARNRRELAVSNSNSINNSHSRGSSPARAGLRPLTLSPRQAELAANGTIAMSKHKKSPSMPVRTHLSPSLMITREIRDSRESRQQEAPIKANRVKKDIDGRSRTTATSNGTSDADSIIDGYVSSEAEEKVPDRRANNLQKPLPVTPADEAVEPKVAEVDEQQTKIVDAGADRPER